MTEGNPGSRRTRDQTDKPYPMASPVYPELTRPIENAPAAYHVLLKAITTRMQTVHDLWKQARGYEGTSWKEIHAKPEMTEGKDRDIAVGFVDFEPQWQQGTLLGGTEFNLVSLDRPAAEVEYWGEDYAARLDAQSLEENIASPFKTFAVSTKLKDKVENWIIWIIPGTLPYAVNTTDTVYLKKASDDPRAVRHVTEIFGEDAAPRLSEAEMSLLADAILKTPAKIGEV